MQIALFGGTFNPPHKGHQAVVRLLLRHADAVWIVVANRPNKTARDLAPARSRLSMARLAFSDSRVRVLDEEIRRGGVSYTIDTLYALKKKFPKYEFRLVIGSDLVPAIARWKSSKKLYPEPFWIVFRPYVAISKKALSCFQNYLVLRGKGFEISSTELRGWLKTKQNNKSKRYLPKNVAAYIRKEKLYL